MKRLAFAFALTTVFASTCAAHWWFLSKPVVAPSSTIVITQGDTLSKVASELSRQGLLGSPRLFTLFAQLAGADKRIRAGHYDVDGRLSPAQILALITSDRHKLYRVTVAEGLSSREILDAVQGHPEVRSELVGLSDPWFDSVYGALGGVEGWFFPDTYFFAAGTSDKDLFLRGLELMRQTLDEVWVNRDDIDTLATSYDALILASIIEKETGLDGERKAVSGVFHRRLKRGMRLQTDPTVIYGLGEAFDGDLRRRDLRDPGNQYNTYQIVGLPPGPIASPGRASLEAAVSPARGTALYFVADGRGGHVFSDTLAEHEQAVQNYLRILRESR